jgi:hypothetical protein
MPIYSTLEDFMKKEKAQYYDTIIKLGFHGRYFKNPKRSVRIIIIPTSAQIAFFSKYGDLPKSKDAIIDFRDKWRNHYIDFEVPAWF